MLRIEQVLGSRLDPALAERIHELEQQDAVDFLTVPIVDVSRHRFRARTQGGTEVAIALTRPTVGTEECPIDGIPTKKVAHR